MAFRFLASILPTSPVAGGFEGLEEVTDAAMLAENAEALSEISSKSEASAKALSHLEFRSSFSSLSPGRKWKACKLLNG